MTSLTHSISTPGRAGRQLFLIMSLALVVSTGNAKDNQYCIEMFSDTGCSCNVLASKLTLECPDASQVDWEHLDGSNFTELTLSKVGNGLSIFASQLPYLPTVTTLGLQECNNSSFSIPSPWLLPNLKHLLLKNNNLTDKDLDRLLGPWKGIRVAHIDLGHNQLTVFPEPLLSFPALVTIKLNNNNLKSLMAALNFSSFVVEMIDLSYNSIRTIERTNAFHGILPRASILVAGNPLFNNSENALASYKLASRVGKLDLGSVDCSTCFMGVFAHNGGHFLASQSVLGKCYDGRALSELKMAEYPIETCPNISSGVPSIVVKMHLLVLASTVSLIAKHLVD